MPSCIQRQQATNHPTLTAGIVVAELEMTCLRLQILGASERDSELPFVYRPRSWSSLSVLILNAEHSVGTHVSHFLVRAMACGVSLHVLVIQAQVYFTMQQGGAIEYIYIYAHCYSAETAQTKHQKYKVTQQPIKKYELNTHLIIIIINIIIISWYFPFPPLLYEQYYACIGRSPTELLRHRPHMYVLPDALTRTRTFH